MAMPTDPALMPSPPADLTQPEQQAVKERHSLTLDQRRALRRWANSQTLRPSHKACIEWFYAQYGHQISQSTVSHSLSPKYSRLDGDNPQLSGSRLRFGNWPDVEKLVLLWYQQVQAAGRQPTNDELGEKAKSIFMQLPRYRDENAPEFSPGWIHRFKKRYGLLIRRQRRPGDGCANPAEDIDYLADCVPRVMAVAPDTSPAAIKEQVLRVVGVEASLSTCALVRDEIVRRVNAANQSPLPQHNVHHADPLPPPPPPPEQPMYADDDPEVVLQNALRQLQQEEQAAEEQAAAAREERERAERAGLHAAGMVATPGGARDSSSDPRYTTPAQEMGGHDLTLTPIHSDGPISSSERPIRCPFCVNQRMLRTIKEAVEHMSTHVVV
ncbi:centromere binding protein Cbh2 [Metarhizium album ARSEF 1941]|uniref:Centromere binding protein Cbh2 n=1 Tax=Metarhizium album (strain ARSEF 1941) TaxID=1081103 RepID=A0A0B2WU64_METAS|nr:centromere binding protein Cbh2 [Metarhizium album ARSEF 1941]KHN97007.1 centromere binding protein Cbh2 [Metarhizium album ARSEF 1941]